MSRYSIVLLNDWRRVRNRHSGMTLLNLSGDWLAGEWITGEVTVFGLGLTLTRWSRRPVPVELLGRGGCMGDSGEFQGWANEGREHAS